MERLSSQTETGTATSASLGSTFHRLITDHADTLAASEKLLAQIGDTLLCLSKKDDKGFFPFVREQMVWLDTDEHPTTAAQCVSALQDVTRTVGSINLKRAESPSQPFLKIDAYSFVKGTTAIELKRLRSMLKNQTAHLAEEIAATEDAFEAEFGRLNPFTSAQVFRALAPTEHLLSNTCWRALLGILWALARTHPNYGTKTGVSMPQSLPTAFVTSRCIEAVETLVEVMTRRRARLERFTDLVAALEALDSERVMSTPAAKTSLPHKSSFIFDRMKACLDDFAMDAVLPELFMALKAKLDLVESKKDAFSAEQLKLLFVEAAKTDCVKGSFAAAKRKVDRVVDDSNKYYLAAKGISCSFQLANWDAKSVANNREWLKKMPSGLVDARYSTATHTFLDDPSKRADPLLVKYWSDHGMAIDKAMLLCRGIAAFLTEVIDKYEGIKKTDKLSDAFRLAAARLDELLFALTDFLTASIQSCVATMLRQLAHARSNQAGDFDPAELAHAARVVARSGSSKQISALLESVDAISKHQRADGGWSCTQPFYWTAGGLAALPHSAEVAWALVSILTTITRNPEAFSLSQIEAIRSVDSGNGALRRFSAWLNTNARSYLIPEVLRVSKGSGQPKTRLFGWGSDRTPEPSLIHAWTTANVAEFLVEHRAYLQTQINLLLRVQFLSYHPADLETLDSFNTPDLSTNPYADRLVISLWRDLQHHNAKAQREQHWMPLADYAIKPAMYSAILGGPPGSAKTYLAKRIAGELGWPLISLSPSDFLSEGEGELEARARQIFENLREGRHLVYFFDEIDELILDRTRTQKETSRSVFSFLTPSFLTKLQDLHDAAEGKSFIFLIGTNYVDRIDSAAKRSGRIDRNLYVLYPDRQSRLALIYGHFARLRKESEGNENAIKVLLSENSILPDALAVIADVTALMSVPGLLNVCNEVLKAFSKRVTDQDWKALKKNLELLREERSDWGRREVNLDVYAGRSGAVDEWMYMLGLLKEAFHVHSRALLDKELKAYLESLKNDPQSMDRVIQRIRKRNDKLEWWIPTELQNVFRGFDGQGGDISPGTIGPKKPSRSSSVRKKRKRS